MGPELVLAPVHTKGSHLPPALHALSDKNEGWALPPSPKPVLIGDRTPG